MPLKKTFSEHLAHFKKKSELIADVDQLITEDDKKDAIEKLRQIAGILKEERRAIRELSRYMKHFVSIDPTLSHVSDHIVSLDESLRKQQLYLRLTNIYAMIRYNMRNKYKTFRKEFENQVGSQKKFRSFLQKKLKALEKDPAFIDFVKEEQLYTQFYKQLRTLLRLKDLEDIRNKAVELLDVTEQLKKTLLYKYMKKDIDTIQKKLKDIRDNPDSSRISYILAGAYIVSPGTFELTFLYLMIRYMGKYMTDDTSPVRKGYKTFVKSFQDDKNKYI